MDALTHLYTASIGASIADWLAANIRPIFLILVGLGVLRFVISQEFSRLLSFAAMAMVVGLFVFAPGVVEDLIGVFADLIRNGIASGGG